MGLIPNNYDDLVSAMRALAEDDSQEFQAFVPTAVYLAEERLVKELDTDGLISAATVTAVPNFQFMNKPSGCRFIHEMYYRTSAKDLIHPIRKTDTFLIDYWPATTSTSAFPNGKPKYYANWDFDTLVLAPTPSSAYRFTIRYVTQQTHLSAGNQTNYYTDFCSDALYYGTMSNMAEFMKDYEVQKVWESKYVNAVQGLNNQGRRNRRDDQTVPRGPSINTLKGEA